MPPARVVLVELPLPPFSAQWDTGINSGSKNAPRDVSILYASHCHYYAKASTDSGQNSPLFILYSCGFDCNFELGGHFLSFLRSCLYCAKLPGRMAEIVQTWIPSTVHVEHTQMRWLCNAFITWRNEYCLFGFKYHHIGIIIARSRILPRIFYIEHTHRQTP